RRRTESKSTAVFSARAGDAFSMGLRRQGQALVVVRLLLVGLIVLRRMDETADVARRADQLFELAGALLHDGCLHGRVDARLRQLLRQLFAAERLQARALAD